jgi:hypothetical protein
MPECKVMTCPEFGHECKKAICIEHKNTDGILCTVGIKNLATMTLASGYINLAFNKFRNPHWPNNGELRKIVNVKQGIRMVARDLGVDPNALSGAVIRKTMEMYNLIDESYGLNTEEILKALKEFF